jgi:MFS family permease
MIGPILLFGAISAYFAHKRGYQWLYWFLACGLIGMIVVILMPSAKKEGLSEEKKAKIIKRGNLVGIILTVVWVLLMVAVNLLTYFAKAHQR